MKDAALWISTEAFAEAAGISRQAASRILRLSLTGQPWRRRRLRARLAPGRGGRGGLAYEVDAACLPEDLHIPSAPSPDEVHAPVRRTVQVSGQISSRLNAIQTALQYESGSPERAREIALSAMRESRSERTLYRWLSNYQVHGLRGLERARPSNAGERRAWVSRPFDQAFLAAGYSADILQAIASDVEKSLKGLWASRAERSGSTEIRRMAEFLLEENCTQRGFQLPKSAFRLSRRTVERFAHFRVVNVRKNDRKAFDDSKPRIRRDWTALAPMERVVGDVKHLDVIVTRADGTPAWPKIVALMDTGTGRVFAHPVLLQRGEGVRQEHVIEAFLAMVADPAWGFPQGLYLDNGSEFAALSKIDHALQLLNSAGARTIIYAKPYNASAKPIESLFARLDRYVFSQLPGYAGPDRLAKKTQTVGRPPKPYPGDWAEFCGAVQSLIAAYHLRPVGGLWGDRSPQDWLRTKIDEGWRVVAADTADLDAAFSDQDSRRLDRGIVKINGVRFSHPELDRLPHRTVVDLALPWRRTMPPMAKVRGHWIYLQRDIPVPARWIAGAQEADRRQVSQNRFVSSLGREAARVDPVSIKARLAAQAVALVPPKAMKLDLGSANAERRADGLEASRADAEAAKRAAAKRAREMSLTEKLERSLGLE